MVPGSPDVDVAALQVALRRNLSGVVSFDNGSRALYATDGSNYRQVPIERVCSRAFIWWRKLSGLGGGVLGLNKFFNYLRDLSVVRPL